MRFLSVVAKRPAPGQTKTRLCPPLDGTAAATLYACFLQDTLSLMRQVPDVCRTLAYAPPEELAYFRALAPDFALVPQQGADLGERLDNLLSGLLQEAGTPGPSQAVVMDSDSPTLPPAYLADAFQALDQGADVVLGPCDDGGYYLIGLTRPQPRLLREVTMSTDHVLQDTLAIARELGLAVALLPTWYDVDTAAELERLEQELATLPATVAPATRGWFAARGLGA
ncbi:MAG: hypothetical protein KatS3mg050_4535 [Litorilinea sp.]|nr:MAG: hypothetical protein KatS3mg050_4535 [Litorilinea sp.]